MIPVCVGETRERKRDMFSLHQVSEIISGDSKIGLRDHLHAERERERTREMFSLHQVSEIISVDSRRESVWVGVGMRVHVCVCVCRVRVSLYVRVCMGG